MNSMSSTALITGASGGVGYELAKLFANDRHNVGPFRNCGGLGRLDANAPLHRTRAQTDTARHNGPMLRVPARAAQATRAGAIEHRTRKLRQPVDQERGHLRRHVTTLRLNNVTQIFRSDMGGPNQYARYVAAQTPLTVDDTLGETAAYVVQDPAAPRQIQRGHRNSAMPRPALRQRSRDRLPAAREQDNHRLGDRRASVRSWRHGPRGRPFADPAAGRSPRRLPCPRRPAGPVRPVVPPLGRPG